MSVQVSIENPSVDHRSHTLSAPDDKEVFWARPHDMKLEMYAVLKAVLAYLGKGDVPIVQDGAFQPSLLTDEHQNSQTVICIGRTADSGFRRAIGSKVITTTAGDPRFFNSCGTLDPDTVVDVFSEWSNEQVDITIADTNSTRANEMYQIVKTIMIFAEEQMRNIGYEDFIRTNGMDQTVDLDAPGVGIVFMKILSYRGTHRDEAIAIPEIATLVAQRQTITPPGASSGPTVTSGL